MVFVLFYYRQEFDSFHRQCLPLIVHSFDNFLIWIYIECCAAAFLQKLIQDASTSAATDDSKTSAEAASSSTMVIQLQHVQSAAVTAKYTFLGDELKQVQDSSAPKAGLTLRKAKKRRIAAAKNKATKVPSGSLVGRGMTQERVQLQQVLDQQGVMNSDAFQGTGLEVIEDEDDYDWKCELVLGQSNEGEY